MNHVHICIASPPLKPPSFTPPYSGVMRLAQCSVLHRMLHCILKQASTLESKFWSDKLLHETLYLCGVILVDEDSNHPDSLCNAAIGISGSKHNNSTTDLVVHKYVHYHFQNTLFCLNLKFF